ncbi:MAG TPA: ABC transporter permease [Thermoanaerobaculia bacterium]|nr:ABC transporter permease [Thermoanaerobaculia bacterium]
MGLIQGIRVRLRLLLERRAADSRADEEIRFHVAMEADRLRREEGLDAREARRRALLAFGGVEKTKEELRDGRGLGWLTGLPLDLKVGARMLSKYPVLTLASALSLAVAVAVAAAWFEFMIDIVRPRLPLPEGERIVTLRNRDLGTATIEPRSLHDFETWRRELRSIQDLAAASTVESSLTTEDGRVGAVDGVRATASLFRLGRVQPLLGRLLTPADLEPGAPPVIVLGHAAWQRLFDGDTAAIGETVRLGAEAATLVGVMPAGFGFPVNEELWMPLRANPLDHERRAGPPLVMLGRLAPGVGLEEARAELALVGERTAAEFPQTHEHLRPEVQLFGRGNDMARPAALLNVPFLLFLVVVSANVATLLFARTARRGSEIAMRSALGASRRRIVLQLVTEALVLTSMAAVLGLTAAHWGLRWGMDLFWEVQQTRPPFWFDSGLSAASVVYVCILAGIGAAIIGGVPALRATRRELRHRLPSAGADAAGMRFGTVATAVIVVQVGLCVAFLPIAILNGRDLLAARRGSDFPAESFLTARLMRPLEEASPARDAATEERETWSAERLDEVRRRLHAQPGVLAVTRTDRLPGLNHPVEPVQLEDASEEIVAQRVLDVDPDFFEVVGASVATGRSFTPADVASRRPVAIVGDAWARETFGGPSAIGARFRYPQRSGEEGNRWYEIVGTVTGIERAVGPGKEVAIFHPLRPAEHSSVHVYLRVADAPETLLPQIPELVAAVDPRVGVADLVPLDDVWRPVERSDAFFVMALGVVAAIILLFALIGIYALMSFTVTQRAREIGIRAALGADPRRIVVSIFSRAMAQIGLGVVAGAVLVSLTVARDPEGLRLVAGVAAAMVVVGLAGCFLPVLRALRIHPTEAFRAE